MWWAVVGLGNPGQKYSKSRHNVGFMVADEVALRHGIALAAERLCGIGRGSVGGREVVLVEPWTFMNRSGLAVAGVLGRFGIAPENLIVLHDDLDMETGRLKIRKGGSSGGHKGVESIIATLGTGDFIRVKIGIGRDPAMPSEDYVLRKFKRAEAPLIKEAVCAAADAVESLLSEGLSAAMNTYNKKK